jgi:hypothetical protein
VPFQPPQHPCCCYENSTAAKGLTNIGEASRKYDFSGTFVNEAVNAEYTFLGTSLAWMPKGSLQGGIHGVPQESCTARLAAGCTEIEPA